MASRDGLGIRRRPIIERVQKYLDTLQLLALFLLLNMFKTPLTTTLTQKAEATSIRILDVALDLFRRRGFEQTTMRGIATEAGVSLGSAY